MKRKKREIEKRENLSILILAGILIFSVSMIAKETTITGFASSGTTISNVTISSYLSISMSTNLSDGILFGNISALPAADVNASHNYDGIPEGAYNSSLFVNVSTDSNVNVDFCLQADADFKEDAGGTLLLVGNETYGNSSTTNDVAEPAGPSGSTQLTTSYVKTQPNVAPGYVAYYRFWLDIPAAQPAGDYNNTVTFKGIKTGDSC